MKANLERIEKNQVALEVEIEAARFEKALDQAYRRVVQKVNVPGFRKGKTPRKILEARFGKEILMEDALDIILPEAYNEAVEQSEIDPIDQPKIDLVQAEPGEPFIFKATVEVKPEVDLGQYKGLELTKKITEVTDKQVDNYLEILQRRHAKLVDLEEGTIANEDLAIIDFTGMIEGEPFPGGEGKDYSLMIGSGTFIPGFEEQLIGLAVGEEKEIEVPFPADYHVDKLAGQNATFKVTVKGLKRKEFSPIDDEFAKDVSEFETLKELRESVANRLKQISETKAVRDLQNEAVSKAAANATVESPKVLVERRIDTMIGNLADRLASQGLTVEKYMEIVKTTREQLREDFRPEAEQSVKIDLVLEAIAKKETLAVTEEELNEAIAKLAEGYKKTPEELSQTFAEQGVLSSMKGSILMEKTVDFLVAQAEVKEEIVPAEDEPDQVAGAADQSGSAGEAKEEIRGGDEGATAVSD
jgi:trigger factor